MLRKAVSHCFRLQLTQPCAVYRSTGLMQGTSRCHPIKECIHGYHLLQASRSVVNCRNISYSFTPCKNDSSVELPIGTEAHVLQNQGVCEASGDAERLEEARKEVADLLAIGWQAPEKISDPDLEHYLTLTTKKGRKKFLRFLCKKEIMKKSDKIKKEERARQRAALKEQQGTEEDDDAFPNRMFLRVQSNTILQFHKWRLASGIMFGPKIAFDFSYEDLMRRQEVISLVQQLMHVISANKHAKDPFSVHWVGLKDDSQSLREMKRMLGGSLESTMVNETDKDLLEIFPKEKLIYLSADSPNILQSYDSDKVYVVGALVDSHIIYTGQSLARAKRHGIDHARLPLDKHLQWTTGAKNLTLDQMMKIMIEMNTSGDWVKALQHVPIRKHAGLRSGPHWDQGEGLSSSPRKRKQDGIQRNPSQFVSSRARQSKNFKGYDHQAKPSSRRKNFQSNSNRSYEEDDNDTDSTLFTSRARSKNSWFDDNN